MNQDVLIPRPETELLVELVLTEARTARRQFAHALDVGTGSGVILLSLLAEGGAREGTAVDISPRALRIALQNSRNLRLHHRCRFVLSDRFENVPGAFDLIVSNPPYIKASAHRGLVQRTVDEFEPPLALYLDDGDYEAWFQKFFHGVRGHLAPGGLFFMEGHELELASQAGQLAGLGFKNVSVLKDLAGRDRFLKAMI